MIGQTVSHYRITEKLGKGGMGVVYKAEDLRLQRSVALKFLARDLVTDPEAKSRFIHEARAASSLEHPNICTIHDVEETEDGRMFISMAFCEGETLRARITRGPLPVETIVSISEQVLAGLEKAHTRGIVHRDIKPDNIMISPDGIVKILDFGIAKNVHQGTLAESSGFGTAGYMAPEQIRGESIDARADLWAFGVTLYEMAAGRLPFTGLHPPALMYQIVNEEPPDILTVRKELPEAVARTIAACLEKDRERRSPTARETLHLLRPEGISARPASRPLRISARTMLWIFSGLALLCGAAWLASILFFPAPPRTGRYRIAILPMVERSPHSGDEGNSVFIQSLLNGELTGVEEFSVHDFAAVNADLVTEYATLQPTREPNFYNKVRQWDVDYTVEIARTRMQKSSVVQLMIHDTKEKGVLFSTNFTVPSDSALIAMVPLFSRKIKDFFKVNRVKDDNLKPWYSVSANNVEAIRAFLTASDYFIRAKQGGEPFLREAIRLDSTFIAPRVWLISQLIGRRELNNAWGELKAIERLQTGANPFESALIDYLQARIGNNTLREKRALEIALDYSPGNSIILVNLAYRKYALGDYEGALKALERPLKAHWIYPHLYTTLATIYRKMGRSGDAMKSLEEGLTLNPRSAVLCTWMTAIAHAGKDTAKMRTCEEKALELCGENGFVEGDYHAMLAAAYDAIEDTAASLAAYRRAIELTPSKPGNYVNAAEILLNRNETDEARRHIEKAVALDPADSRARYLLGIIQEKSGDVSHALDNFRKYLIRDSVSVDARAVLARHPALRILSHH